MTKMPAPLAQYINVDLEVRSRADLQPLVDALSRSLFSLYAGREGRGYLATFENGSGTRGADTPDRAIQRIIRVVDGLRPEVRRHWNRARDRVFDIGVAKTSGSKVFYLPLAAKTVQAAARIGARIALSFYPPYYP
jgi:hypothetical protein